MSNLASAQTRIVELAQVFHQHRHAYLAPGYPEARVRQDFIDKFFVALGWDVLHERQLNPFEQEVRVEKAVSDGSSQRRADYAFFLHPNFRDVRFFVEAKKPFGDIATQQNYFQSIRYGWNSQVPLVVLTDFEQFHVIDCRYKPNIETSLQHCVLKFHYSEYQQTEQFSQIYHLFSREAVESGSLSRFVEGLPVRRGPARQRGLFRGGYQPVDAAFLEELADHREHLAKSLKRDNPDFDGQTLTEITQRVLDRLVFVRFLEDKGIEAQFSIEAFGSSGSAFEDFRSASAALDRIYNGIIFKPHAVLDGKNIRVSDDDFGDICERLSHLNSPYDFNAIPIHILGSIYERFLGSVIVATEKRARVEQKIEVRKAGGVYYTPVHVVRHIAEATLRPLVHGKTPAQVAKLKVGDIACGSGSFLLGAYEFLLTWHREWYNANPSRVRDGECVPADDGTLKLSLRKRREILVNSIFGNDLDPQAVEVAQLSLYLKLLEDENTSSAHSYTSEFREALLPPLGKNVICGNSLVEEDVLAVQVLSKDQEIAVSPMQYRSAFPTILDSGGFDAIIGNPPYVRPHKIASEMKEYLWAHFHTFTHKSDLYCCFVERASSLLKQGGKLGLILSRGWLALNSFQNMRKLLLAEHTVNEIVEMKFMVFEDAQVETCIVISTKSKPRSSSKISIVECRVDGGEVEYEVVRTIQQSLFLETFQNVFDLSLDAIALEIKRKMGLGVPIGENFNIVFGLKTADDERYLHHVQGAHSEDRPLIRGDDIRRYGIDYKGEYVWYVPKDMRRNRPTARPGDRERFEQPKVLVKDTSKNFSGTYESGTYYVKDALIVVPKVRGPSSVEELLFVTAVINSKVMTYFYRSTFPTLHVQNQELASLPLPRIANGDTQGIELKRRVVECVRTMLELEQRPPEEVTERESDYQNRKIATIDAEIDRSLFDLYGLNVEERDYVLRFCQQHL